MDSGKLDSLGLFSMSCFQPLASSFPKIIKDSYSSHEQLKKLKYETRISKVENSYFNPLVFAVTGGTGPSTTKVIKRLAEKIADKKNERYSDTINLIRSKVSFALLRSCLLCLRGCRASKKSYTPADFSVCNC